MEVVYIMWLRQLKRFWRSKSRIIGNLAQPVLFFLAFGFGFGAMFKQANGSSYIEFLAPGIIAMSILFNAMFNGIEVIWDRQFGFLKETLVAPVSRIKLMIGRTLGGATVSFMQGVFILLIAMIFGFKPSGPLIFLSFVFMFLIALFFTAAGTAFASKIEDMHAFPLIMNFITMPLFFLSGALFPLENVPAIMGFIIKINPLSYGVDGIRGSLIGTSSIGLGVDLIVIAILTAIAIWIGGYLFSKTEA